MHVVVVVIVMVAHHRAAIVVLGQVHFVNSIEQILLLLLLLQRTDSGRHRRMFGRWRRHHHGRQHRLGDDAAVAVRGRSRAAAHGTKVHVRERKVTATANGCVELLIVSGRTETMVLRTIFQEHFEIIVRQFGILQLTRVLQIGGQVEHIATLVHDGTVLVAQNGLFEAPLNDESSRELVLGAHGRLGRGARQSDAIQSVGLRRSGRRRRRRRRCG